MKRRLAVIDLDDTLLDVNKQVSRENKAALQTLREAGCEIVIASGRHHENIRGFAPEIGAMNWIISSQGAAVRGMAPPEVICEYTLLQADALALCEAGRAQGSSLIIYHRNGVFIEAETEWTRLYASRAGWQPRVADLAALVASGVQKVIFYDSAAAVARTLPILQRFYRERCYLVVTDDESLEVLSLRANKGIAAEMVAAKLEIAQSDVLAFGDGNNDVELLAWAGFSVAMAHGRAAAKSAAKAISPVGPAETAFARGVELALAKI